MSAALGAGLITACAPPATAERVRHLGLLQGGSTTPDVVTTQRLLLAALADRGYAEGKNLVLDQRRADGDNSLLPRYAAELVTIPVDVIVTNGATATRVATQSTSTIPIVMYIAADAIEEGLITSLAHPGGNVTGVTFFGGDILVKAFEVLSDSFSAVARIAYAWDPATGGAATALARLQDAALTRHVRILSVAARSRDEILTGLARATADGADALMVLRGPATLAAIGDLFGYAAARSLPAMYPAGFAELGGLMSFGPLVSDTIPVGATYIDRILRGARPADLPVALPTTFELVINAKTAAAQGLTIPAALLARATSVIR